MRKRFACAAAVLLLLVLATPQPGYAQTGEGYHFFLTVSGTWTSDNASYASRIIHYPGWEACNRYSSSEFVREVRRAFGEHLRAHHNSIFRNGPGNNVQTVQFQRHSTSSMLTSRGQAQTRMTQWIAEQRDRGFSVEQTNFSFSCANL